MTAAGGEHEAGRVEVAQRSRTSGLIIAIVALLVVPAWGGFDYLLEPRYAPVFVLIRTLCDIPVLLLLWALAAWPIGRRRPEVLTVGVLVIIQSEIAWMVVRASHSRDFYLLGFSLALYASGCLMGGPPRWTAAVVAATWAALGAAMLTAPHPMSQRDLVAAAFYLSTASVIAVVGHAQRDRLSARERVARDRLYGEQDRTRLLMDRLERLSHEDPLTGLANRRRWDTEMDLACARARASGSPVALLLIDIDRFKEINDRNGHAAGDQTLRDVASTLNSAVDQHALVARLGGDEYGVLLPDTEAVGAAAMAEHLRRSVFRSLPNGDGTVSLSVGVAAATGDEAQPDRLMTRADFQLYRAKTTRNAVAL